MINFEAAISFLMHIKSKFVEVAVLILVVIHVPRLKIVFMIFFPGIKNYYKLNTQVSVISKILHIVGFVLDKVYIKFLLYLPGP